MNRNELTITFLASFYPWPTTNGGRIATAALFEWWIKHHPVNLIAFRDPQTPQISQAKSTTIIPLPAAVHVRRFVRLLRGWSTGRPYFVEYFASSAMRRATASIHPRNVILCDLAMAQYVRNRPLVLIAHNVEYDLANQRFKRETGVVRLIWWIEMLLLRAWEAKIIRQARFIISLSPADAARFEALYGVEERRISVLIPPLTESWSTPDWNRSTSIAFIGSQTWPENREALQWFLSAVVPHIPSRYPILVAGQGTQDTVRTVRLNRKIKVIEGFSSVEEFVNEIRVLAVPLLHGSGIRIKILQALQAMIPVVSTNPGVHGLPPETGIAIADDPETFAGLLIKLCDDEAASRAQVQQGFEWWRGAQAESAHTLASLENELRDIMH